MRAPPGAACRALAARILDAVLGQGRSLKAELGKRLPELADPRDRALVEAICFEALRWRRRYEFVLEQWLQRPLPAKDAVVQRLLLVGLAQLDALKLPPHAALAATAEAARSLGKPTHVGLVNALLRRATRGPWPQSNDSAVAQSHPDWLVARLHADWPDDLDALLAANNRAAPLWLRVNARRVGRDGYRVRLREAGLDADAPTRPATALQLAASLPPAALPGWAHGDVSVQDGAAQLAVEALAPKTGERVLDACAAPGGKAAHLLESVGDLRLTVVDVDAGRLARVRETLARLRLENAATLAVADAADRAAPLGDDYDAILLDAPCSASGIIRRQPDIKWHRRESDLDGLVALQSRLLDALWPRLKPGGRLLYATCSVLRAENARQIDAFLARTPDAAALALDDRYGRVDGAGRQRLPGEDGMDGFFYALLRKAT